MYTKILSKVREIAEMAFEACNLVEEELKKKGYGYMRDENLGYITNCPSQLGMCFCFCFLGDFCV